MPVRVTVLLPGVLREYADGQHEVALDLAEGSRIVAVLGELGERWPLLGARLRDETGALRRHVNLFVDGADVRANDGLQTPLYDAAVVHVLPSVAGG